jgi:F-type H+-transporting ATPase subunit epsilon
MQLQFVTLAGPKLERDVYEVVLPTADGSIVVYPGHMPLVTTLVPGVVAVRNKKDDPDSARDVFASNGGVAEISGTAVRILVDEADHADDIVEQQAADALAAARTLKDEAKDEIELERAAALIDREAVRLKVAELRRHSRSKS